MCVCVYWFNPLATGSQCGAVRVSCYSFIVHIESLSFNTITKRYTQKEHELADWIVSFGRLYAGWSQGRSVEPSE